MLGFQMNIIILKRWEEKYIVQRLKIEHILIDNTDEEIDNLDTFMDRERDYIEGKMDRQTIQIKHWMNRE